MRGATRVERGFFLLVLVGAGVYLAHGVAPHWLPEQKLWMQRYGAVVKVALEALGAVWALKASHAFEAENPAGKAWRQLGAGLLLVLAGQLWLAPDQLAGRTAPFPSFADLPFLLAYLPIFAALVTFLRAYRAAGFPEPKGLPDSAWVAGVLGVALAFLWPAAKATLVSGDSILKIALSLAYPLADLLLIVPAVLVLRLALRFQGGEVARVWIALVAGIASWVVADTLYAWPSDAAWIGPVSNAGYVLAYGGLALAALAQRQLLARDAA